MREVVAVRRLFFTFYQRVSIASYASAVIARAEMSVCPSVRPSVTLRYCIKTKKVSVMTFSPSESPNILVSMDHHENRKGSPRARAIYKTGLGKNWKF